MNHFLQSSRQQRRVLVVDDELINRELLETILSMNYEVTAVSNGMDALAALRKEPKAYSLILLDIIMPQMSGFDVIQACKGDEALKNIPIIVMTSEKSAEVRSIHMGAADFIAKPYRMPEVIIARCERIIELNEERELIRSIEKDPVTQLYVRLFFDAYLARLSPTIRGSMDAVAIKIDGLESIADADVRDAILKKVADLLKESVISRKGLGCRADDTMLFVYCRHKQDYEKIIMDITYDLHSDSRARGVTLRAGICPNTDIAVPSSCWYTRAAELCDSIPVKGENLTAVCTNNI